MKILGLKPARWVEWAQIVRRAGPGGWHSVANAALFFVLRGTVAGRTYRQRLRACAGCPIYDKETRKCADTVGLGQGCGCYMPVKALARSSRCWAEGAYGQSEWSPKI